MYIGMPTSIDTEDIPLNITFSKKFKQKNVKTQCFHTITLGVAIPSPSITGVWPLLQLPPSSNRLEGSPAMGDAWWKISEMFKHLKLGNLRFSGMWGLSQTSAHHLHTSLTEIRSLWLT